MQEVPSKKSEKVNLAGPLKKYISSNYSEDPSKFENDLQTIDELRTRAVNNPDVDNCTKYFGQLQLLGAKFPINEKGVKVQFPWYHAFQIKKKFTSSGINFEKGAILFNLAAAYSQRGKQQNLNTADGVKLAYNFYQMAAGAFAMLRENAPAWFVEATSTDFSLNVLKSLELHMLAQAQESFLIKATADKKSPSILSKLAGQAADLYDQAFDAASLDQANSAFEGRLDWLLLIQVKALYLNGLAHFHLTPGLLTAMKYGEEIARLHLAMSFVQKAAELSKTQQDYISQIKDLHAIIVSRLRVAEKDNDTIYLETIPPFKSLNPIGRHLMVKSLPLPDITKLSVIGNPLFQNLIPVQVHKTAADYKQKKETHVFGLLTRMDKATGHVSGTLSSMNLPTALDALEQPIGLPPSLLLRSREVRAEGGAASLNATLEHLTISAKQILETFAEGVKLLEKEEQEDNQLRNSYGSRWVRTPSAILNESLKNEASKYTTTVQSASKADTLVKNKISNNFALIEQLGGTEQDLEKAVPSSGAKEGFAAQNPHIAILRKFIQDAADLKKENEALADEIKSFAQGDDIVPVLLEVFGLKPITDPSECFASQLKNYDPFASRVTAQIEKAEQIVAGLLETNQKFVASKTTNEFIAKREEALKKLDNGYNAYKEIKSNLKEGMKFYNGLESLASIFKGKCEDFCVARETEKNDLIAALKAATPTPRPAPAADYSQSMYPGAYLPSSSFASAPPSYGYNPYSSYPQNPFDNNPYRNNPFH